MSGTGREKPVPPVRVANDVIMRTGAASAVGARSHNENDITMTIAGLWIAIGDVWPRVVPL